MPENSDQKREFLRHTVATLAYRGRKAITGLPSDFGKEKPHPGCRSPLEILAHVGDLLDWAVALCGGRHVWHDSVPQSWDKEVSRFFAGLQAFDDFLASDQPLGFPAEQLFQGPVADGLTHIGQIAMCRRTLDAPPVRGENYFLAHIKAGKVGSEQAPAVREFD